jgi:prolyl 4-hydroxylase
MKVLPNPAYQAQELLEKGRIKQAIAVAERAAAQGDAATVFLLATWHLGAYPFSRDVGGAIDLLRQATEIGHVDAALMRIALVANGAASVPDWNYAIMLLTDAAATDPVAALQLQLVLHMTLGDDGGPARPFQCMPIGSKSPVWLLPEFLTPAECAYVAHKGAPMLLPSQITDPTDHSLKPHPVRTSLDAVIGPAREDLVIGAINRRIAGVSKTELGQGEPLTVLCYRQGDQYRPHFDALPNFKNNRMRTVLVYLNDNFTGGETYFPHQELKIKPKAGTAVMFDNFRQDGTPEPASLHAGLAVLDGAKWVASRWIRKDPLNLWDAPHSH